MTIVVVSSGPFSRLEEYRKRMGWTFKWVSSGGTDIFYKNERGEIFHTYSCHDRGNDKLNVHYHYLDLVPKGRDEDGRGPFWVRRRDEYDRQT